MQKMSNKKANRKHRINDCVLVILGLLGVCFYFAYTKTAPEIALLEAAFLGFLFFGSITSMFLGLYFAIKDFSLKY